MRRLALALGIMAVSMASLAVLALFLSSYRLGLITLVLAFAIASLAQNLLTGYADVPSLGNVVFLATSAYVTGGLLDHTSLPAVVVFAVAIGCAAALGGIVGLPALRISGMHLAIVTVALVFATQQVLEQRDSVLPNQVLSVTSPSWMVEDRGLYLLAVIATAMTYFLIWNLLVSRTGRALIALSENPTAASCSGIDLTHYRLAAFMLSGAVSGVAGIIYLYHFQHVSHATFTIDLSLAFLTMMILGGTRSLGGSLVGAAIIGGLTISPQFLPAEVVHINVQESVYGLYALLLLVTLHFFPDGIWNTVASRLDSRANDGQTVPVAESK